MKFEGLDGKTYSITIGHYYQENTNASKLHEQAREFFRVAYPALQIAEEVYISSEGLYLDFFLPVLKIVVECQGVQHDKYNIHFFPSKLDFYRAKARDKKKAEWCQINGLRLVYFYPDEDCETWKKKLLLQS